jgi:hypothetical protein
MELFKYIFVEEIIRELSHDIRKCIIFLVRHWNFKEFGKPHDRGFCYFFRLLFLFAEKSRDIG